MSNRAAGRTGSTRCSRNTITCARSFSPLVPLSLSRLARVKRLPTLLLTLRLLRPTLLPTLRLLLPTLLVLLRLLPPTPVLLLRALLPPLLALLRTLLRLQPTLLLLLRTLPRRCNLRRRAKDLGVGAIRRPFFLPASRTLWALD